MKSLYLVDVSSIFFRAFYAIRSLSNSAGLPTNAVYGFLTMTTKLIKDVRPDYLAFCFDLPGPSFRHEIDPQYKAHRDEMPAELAQQLPYIRRLTSALNIKNFEREGYEADDLIGSLAHWGANLGLKVVIVSGDKDFCQLVSPQVSLYDTMKDSRTEAAQVVAKWGVRPEQFCDFLALVGDSSDNIPGVSGIGLKGAAQLFSDFADLEDIYDHLAQVKSPSVRAKLEAGRDSAYLSRRLVRIVTDLDLASNVNDLSLRPPNKEALIELLTELEFKTFERVLTAFAEPPHSPAAAAVEVVAQVRPTMTLQLAEFRQRFVPGSDLWVLSLGQGLLWSIQEEIFALEAEPDVLAQVLEELDPNWKGYDLKQVWRSFCPVRSPRVGWDHLLAAYVARGGAPGSLAELMANFGLNAPSGLDPAQKWFESLRVLEQRQRSQLSEMNNFNLLEQMDFPLAPVLARMERAGILIDKQILLEQSVELASDLKVLEEKIHHEAGESFNVGSPKQLGQILFEKLKIAPLKKIKTGYSTDTDVLEKLAPQHAIASLVVAWRELAKLKSTYVDALPQLVDAKSGRVHTTFNQALTNTGRLSSTNPNLQNIPIRTARGSAVRKAFVAAPGFQLISADYSQIELRILAHFSEDPALIEAFVQDQDIHAATAARIFDVPIEQVTPELRRSAKAVNFGIAYGQSAFGLSEALRISRAEATKIIDQYFARFSRVRTYMDETIEKAKSCGHVETLFGRRRYLNELKSNQASVRKFGERAAINAPIQGTASDIVKLAMIALDHKLITPQSSYQPAVSMLLQVHDELIFEVQEPLVENCRAQIRALMEGVVALRVPLKVNVAVGSNWEAAHL